ncbi:hypothetical protein CEXT_813811 [Caerostris extrusa]|uniref:Late embryogenesis abundant protein LEA-2 subgroup domain-containing protein n=1 Tax=Caerostris extrusa TaxID=172846 RepID=A0AAV4VW05_CAEEX|nr:hypothetical protein CEXT_813811 [Caerostris extrusa]
MLPFWLSVTRGLASEYQIKNESGELGVQYKFSNTTAVLKYENPLHLPYRLVFQHGATVTSHTAMGAEQLRAEVVSGHLHPMLAYAQSPIISRHAAIFSMLVSP